MKGLVIVSFACLVVHLEGLVSQQGDAPVVGLSGSKHDFSEQPWAAGSLCVACHSKAHGEQPAEAPLWNPSADFNLKFADALQDRGQQRWPSPPPRRSQPYAVDHRSRPGAGTLICMRCHDGTMAGDMFGGLAAPASSNRRHPVFFTTGHGGSNHPVGVAYPDFDTEYQPAHKILSEGAVLLPQGRVECISCHDPHNEEGVRHMLVKRNGGSALCLTCHKK